MVMKVIKYPCWLNTWIGTGFLVLSLTGPSCVIPKGANGPGGKPDLSKKEEPPIPAEIETFIFREGVFVRESLDTLPEPVGGFNKIFMENRLRYPALARENGIQGTLLVTTIVNEFGAVEEYFLKNSLGGGIDEEVLRLMAELKKISFVAPTKNGIPVKAKFDIPFKFSLS